MKSISIVELLPQIGKNIHLIDIRDNYQFQLGNIPGSINVPMNFLLMMPDKYLDKNNTYYVYCEFGSRSKKCTLELEKLGYQVINVQGGYQEYILRRNQNQ